MKTIKHAQAKSQPAIGLIIGAIALLAIIITLIVGHSMINQKTPYQKEIAKRYGDFINYQQPVKQAAVKSRSSTAVSYTGSNDYATAVNLDLHSCTPGAAEIRYANGTMHFAFSGIKRFEGTLTSNDCIFYMGNEKTGQAWNEVLNIECEWIISTLPQYRYRDNVLFSVDDNGIRFGDFLNNCTDLQTGRRPAQL